MKHIFLTAVIILMIPSVADAAGPISFAVTQQTNNLNEETGQVDSMVEIMTTVKHPARVTGLSTNWTHSGLPKDITLKSSEMTVNCSVSLLPGQTCRQRFQIHLDANKACTVNGNYKLQAGILCMPMPPHLSSNCKKSTETIDFSLSSENFCDS